MLSVDNFTIMQSIYMQLSNYSHLGLAPFFYGMHTFHDSVILTLKNKMNSHFILLMEMLHNMELKWIVIYFFVFIFLLLIF